ncbi:MAG: fumarylacetoacetase [Beijerinckiaceae bacterium]
MTPNDPSLRSFVDVPADSDFPIQNLPYGSFSTPANPKPRIGVAIGDMILDLAVIEAAGLLPKTARPGVFAEASLNAFMAYGPKTWSGTRAAISKMLRHNDATLRDNPELRQRAFVARKDATLHLPVKVAGFTDFYSSREHATNAGTMIRGKDNALQANWLHIPIAYNSRASTIVVDGTPIRRPLGQIKGPDHPAPIFTASRRLDFELEMATIVGQPTTMGEYLSVDQAQAAIFGFALLNDWSARDIQAWEYVPLGPFMAKAFATTMGAWVVPAEALEPFRVGGPKQDPEPLPYLRQNGPMNYDLKLEVDLTPSGAAQASTISRTNFSYMYWSPAQQFAHHTSSGCAMSVGDVLGSGTISGPEKSMLGSMLELSWGGKEPLTLTDGTVRSFLEDGDTVTFRGWCQGEGYRIGFGTAGGQIKPAATPPA